MQTTTNHLRGLSARTGLRAANGASDACYAARNWRNAHPDCWLKNQNCYLEILLKECLSVSGAPKWWKDFPPMTEAEACQVTIDKSNHNYNVIAQMGCLPYFNPPEPDDDPEDDASE
jgi:hypothetical protein